MSDRRQGCYSGLAGLVKDTNMPVLLASSIWLAREYTLRRLVILSRLTSTGRA